MPAFLLLALSLIPKLVSAGKDIAAFVDFIKDVVNKGSPTDEDWAKLHAQEEELRDKLHSDDR